MEAPHPEAPEPGVGVGRSGRCQELLLAAEVQDLLQQGIQAGCSDEGEELTTPQTADD